MRGALVELRAVLLAVGLMFVLGFAGCVPAAAPVAAGGVQVQVEPETAPKVEPVASVADSVAVGSARPAVEAAQPAIVAALPSLPVGAKSPSPLSPIAAPETVSVSVSKNEPHPRAGQYKHTLTQQSHYVWGLDAPVSSFAAQIHQESRWSPTARSPVGAAGLTQFMPATAQWIRTMDGQLSSGDVYNPVWAMRALVVYDQFLYKKVSGSNPCERLAFAMSAYNGGLGWVNKRKARSPNPQICFGVTCDINPGVSPASQRENAGYPRVILQTFEPLYVKAGWGRGVCTNKF